MHFEDGLSFLSYLGRLNIRRWETDEGLGVGTEVTSVSTPHQT